MILLLTVAEVNNLGYMIPKLRMAII